MSMEIDMNELISALQNHYAVMTFEQLCLEYQKHPAVLNVWKDIFSPDTYKEILTMIIKIQESRIKEAKNHG